MINIHQYREFVTEIARAASEKSGVDIDLVRLAVTESQLINMLKDRAGIIVCGNIPGADITYQPGYVRSRGECLLFIIEKMPIDEQGRQSEYDRFARLQLWMEELCRLLLNLSYSKLCADASLTGDLRVEWEYNVYGGFNGLSVAFSLLENS